MKVERLIFSGTADEFRQVAHMFGSQAADDLAAEPDTASEEASSDTIRAFIKRVLTRRHIPNGQLAIFNALYQAGEQGLSRTELAAATDRTEKKIDGVMGALGRRINNTKGIREVRPGGGTGVLLEWRSDNGATHYVMRAELRQVLEEMKIVSP
jgi:hypothetical protein